MRKLVYRKRVSRSGIFFSKRKAQRKTGEEKGELVRVPGSRATYSTYS
jgi:hypothetical protein